MQGAGGAKGRAGCAGRRGEIPAASIDHSGLLKGGVWGGCPAKLMSEELYVKFAASSLFKLNLTTTAALSSLTTQFHPGVLFFFDKSLLKIAKIIFILYTKKNAPLFKVQPLEST